jgi:hypothetical protein
VKFAYLNKKNKMSRHHFYISTLFVLLFFACGEGEKTCHYGNPQAIFSEQLDKVILHQFSTNNQDARELVNFENGLELEIFQSGCDSIQQVFQSKFEGDLTKEPSAYFVEMAIQQFFYLGTVSSEHFSLNYLSQTIRDQFHNIKLGQALELQANYFIKIDKVSSQSETVLIVELMSSI